MNRQELMRSTILGFRFASILLAVYWLAIFIATHLPKVGLPNITNIDKVLHFGVFSILAFLMAWAIPTQMRRPRWNVLVAAVVCVSYAAIDEFSQIPVGRQADVMDWLADVAGVTFGLTVYLISRTLLWRRQGFSPVELSTTR
jgi:VanZ family protein